MKAFTFVRPVTIEEAAKAAAVKGSALKAGGIDLLHRMKERVDEPERVVWLGDVPNSTLRSIESGASPIRGWTGVRIGGGVTLAEIAASELIRKEVPALANAAGSAASPQIRARATLAGNLCQHTRCGYYRHASFPCLKRGDASCPVLADGAVQETAAIFGNSLCASAHASSLAPVLAACDASVVVQRAANNQDGDARMPLAQFYAPPQRGVTSDTSLGAGDVVVCVLVPTATWKRCVYEEVRQRAAFDWALVSCAVCFGQVNPGVDGKVQSGYFARIWLGGVAPTPWRAEAAERIWATGGQLTDETIAAAAEAAVAGATPLPGNAYKVDLVKVVVRRALERLRNMK